MSGAPGVLLVDDIFVELAGPERDEASRLLRELRAMRVTLLVATRGDSLVLSHCSRVVVLRDGRAV
jgi:energy-coupling factor transporter ATP-binding protein EcfA2